jgi:four helix bundle protein
MSGLDAFGVGNGKWEMGNGGETPGSNNNFENLETWRKSIDLAVLIYRASRGFPKEELYGLTNQLRRAVASISASVAEGHGRYSVKEKVQFYSIANGSLAETRSFCYLAQRLGYLEFEQFQRISSLALSVQKLLIALIKSQKARP